ncbi:hypothetical protein [Nonomuraea soli]|uniref:Uncharacterized protein n=1 Tax=Nonomuraea soli TaxID=1032476 RepID=A0A7W0CUY7_9ACTN|nr:hypothetical protein [Nonomuraea soli]MBA2897702.1 hypothetical protein [Nonomuraea soli]
MAKEATAGCDGSASSSGVISGRVKRLDISSRCSQRRSQLRTSMEA